MTKIQEDHNFLYNFLMSPRFRAGRHLLVILVVSFLALNNTISVYHESFQQLGKMVWLVFFFILLVFLTGGYFHLYFLIPRFLLKKKYFRYITLLYLVCLLQILILYQFEVFIHERYHIIPNEASYLNEYYFTFFTLFSELLLLGVANIGVGLAVLLQYWIKENQQIGYLEQVHLRSEVDQLKEQVNPGFLYNILHHSGTLATGEPEKASEMLLHLSRLLRYQLYDGNNEKTLLSAEIQYLANYLKLEYLYSGKVSFEFTCRGNTYSTFVPPLLFLPLVRYAVKEVYQEKQTGDIHLHFNVTGNELIFAVNISEMEDPLQKEDFILLKQRLGFLYKENYSLYTGNFAGEQGIFIILNLKLYPDENI